MMQKSFALLGTAAVCATLLWGNVVVAQQQAAPQPTPVLEIYDCKFKNNKTMKDLQAVTARFNAWADRNKVTDYIAFIATPYLHGADRTSEVLWIGGYPNGNAMGAGESTFFKTGQDINAQFEAVVDCASHAQFAEFGIRAGEGGPPPNPIAVFRDCTMRDGREVPEAITALQQWTQYLTGKGSTGLAAMLFGLAGLPGDAKYTFKYVEGFDNMEAYGKYTDIYTGGGFMRADELLDRVVTCNSPRVYALERVRAPAPQQQ
jgi:hypothetical protein